MSANSPRSKRGLAWPTNNTDPVHLFTKPPSKISWLYNWSPQATPGCSHDTLAFIPMQWNHVNIGSLHEHITACSATHLLGFNEPEIPSQSNLTASHAATEWLTHIQPLRAPPHNIRVGSPGISSAPQGVEWLTEFLRLIRAGGSDIDFYCFHWYGETLGQFYDYIWSTYYRLGPDRPVWITEFAPTNWSEERPLGREHVEEFARKSWEYLDGLEWVERYAWFGAMRDAGNVGKHVRLLDEKGDVTELGKVYRSG
ncbi:MAG: hypothetical protein Q9227_003070 [Pyrenula ochraceoflavens]